jgi:hypothetical protein
MILLEKGDKTMVKLPVTVAEMVRWAFLAYPTEVLDVITKEDLEKAWTRLWSKVEGVVKYYNFHDNACSNLMLVLDFIDILAYDDGSNNLTKYLIMKIMDLVEDPDDKLMARFADYCIEYKLYSKIWAYIEKHNAKIVLKIIGNNTQ